MRSIVFLFFMFFLSTGVALSDDKYTVKVGMGFDPATVNMLEFKVGWDLPVILGMHESLIFTHPETGKRLNSGLAKSVRIINGKNLKFKLHKFAKFHTGDPVTAHDVKFTYEQCANPINRNIMAGRLIISLLTKEPSGPILFGLEMIYAMRDRIDYNWLPGQAFISYVTRTRILK